LSVSQEFRDFLLDQLAGVGPVTMRRMFGGAGVYCDGLMFGLVAGDVLYFKCDAENRADFEAEGLGPFTYMASGKPRAIPSYRRAPGACLDDPAEMAAWGQKALAAARRSQPRGRTRRRN